MSHHYASQAAGRAEVTVRPALLFYKTKECREWKELEADFDRGRGHENIRNISFTERGVSISQQASPGSVNAGLEWELFFPRASLNTLVVDEIRRPDRPNEDCTLTVQFRFSRCPEGKAKSIDTEKSYQKKGSAPSIKEPSPQLAHDQTTKPMLPQIPLARFSNNFEEDKYTEVMLVFRRSKATKGSKCWSWPAVLHLLCGTKSWDPPASKAAHEALNARSLQDWIQGSPLPDGFGYLPAFRGFSIYGPGLNTDLEPSMMPDAAFYEGRESSKAEADDKKRRNEALWHELDAARKERADLLVTLSEIDDRIQHLEAELKDR